MSQHKTGAESVLDIPGIGLASSVAAGLGVGALSVLATFIVPPYLVLFAVIGSAVAVAMLLSPRWAVVATAIVVPIERLGRFSDDDSFHVVSLMRIVGLTAFASFSLHALVRRWKLRIDAPVMLYAGFVTVVFLSYFYSTHPPSARASFFTTTGNLLFFVLLVNVVRDWELGKKAVIAWLCVSTLIGVYQIYGWYFGSAIEANQLGDTGQRFATVWNSESERALGVVRRATGTTSNAAVYGINLILTLPFFAYFLRAERSPWMRVGVTTAAVVVLYNLMLTNTRAVMVLGALALALIVAFRLIRLTPKMLLATVALCLPLMAVVPDSVYQRALDPSNYSLEKSNNIRGRLALWGAAVRAIEHRWLLGYGAGNRTVLPNFTNSPDVDSEVISAHNEYLQTLVDVGLVGGALFAAFIAAVHWQTFLAMRYFRRSGQDEKYWFLVACQLAMLNVLIFGLQVDVFHFPLKGWWLVAGVSCGMLEVARRSESVTDPVPPAART